MCGHVPAGELHLEHVGMPERVRMKGEGRTAWVLVVRRSKGMALRLVISGGMSASSASVACPWPQLAGGGLPLLLLLLLLLPLLPLRRGIRATTHTAVASFGAACGGGRATTR